MIKKLDWNKISIFSIVFMINFIVAINLKMLHISTDEMGVLSSAAYFAGYNWSGIISELPGYYGFGQAIWYIPLFLLIKNPIVLYKAILILNSILVSLIAVISYTIIDKYLKYDNKKLKYLISLTSALFPTYLIYSKWGWYESILSLIPWVILLILLYEVENNKIKDKIVNSIILGIILSYSYACHGRALSFIITTAVVIFIFSVFYKRKIIYYSVLFISFSIFYYIFSIIKTILLNNLWLVGKEGELVNTLSDSFNKIFLIFSTNGMMGLVEGILGQVFYGVSSTYGLLILGIIIGIKFICDNRIKIEEIDNREKNFYLICLYGIILLLISFSISIIFLNDGITSPNGRGDYFIYGRYFSNVLGIIIFIALYGIIQGMLNRRHLKVSIIVFAAISICTLIFISEKINNRINIANIPILNILPYIGNNPIDYIKEINFAKLIIITGSIYSVILFFTYTKKYIYMILVIVGCFLYTYFYVSMNMIIPNSERNINQVSIDMEIINNFGEMYEKYNNIYYIDNKNIKPWSDSKLQFVIPNYKIKNYKGEIQDITKNIKENSLIIATEDLNLEEIDQKIFRINNANLNRDNEYMWIFGSEIKKYLNDEGVSTTNHMNGDLNKFSSSNGISTNEGIKSNGQEGFLLYGPYINLEKGQYKIRLKGQVLSKISNDLGYIDMVKDAGNQIIGEKIYINQLISKDSIIDNTLEFNLDEDANNFEFRIYSNSGVELEITYLEFIKK